MSHILVAYASKHGATAEIAEAIADELGRKGNAVDCLPAGDVKTLDGYDAAIRERGLRQALASGCSALAQA